MIALGTISHAIKIKTLIMRKCFFAPPCPLCLSVQERRELPQ